jgi:hypothetical protein
VVRRLGLARRLVGQARLGRAGPCMAVTAVLGGVLGVMVVAGAAASAANPTQLAARLAARDPGARTGAETIINTSARGRSVGVPDRPNFIIGLGSKETIVGRHAGDQLGAIGDHATIYDGKGNAFIHGGRGARLVARAGHDMLVDTQANAIVLLRSRGNEVIVSGHHDRVLCSAGSRDETIYVGKSDSVGPACRAGHARVLPISRLRAEPGAARAAATVVTGTGSNADPYVTSCKPPTPGSVLGSVCTLEFPARSLSGLWANEYVPSYRCPADYRYLQRTATYRQFGNTTPLGVEIRGLGPIAVSITGIFAPAGNSQLIGQIQTGYPNSSATNWTFGTNSYEVVLHCASNAAYGYTSGHEGALG